MPYMPIEMYFGVEVSHDKTITANITHHHSILSSGEHFGFVAVFFMEGSCDASIKDIVASL